MKIAITSPSFSKNKYLIKEINKYFKNVKTNKNGIRFNKKELINFLEDVDGVIVGLEKIDAEVLDNCKNLKFISKYGVGLDNIDLEECKKRNITIGWQGGINKFSVAEMTLGFMLMLSRNLFISSNKLKNSIWEKDGGMQLSNKVIGIIGVGYIGKELIRILQPFNCKILVNDIIKQDEFYKKYNVIETSKEKIFQESDIITIHIPLNKNTYNLISFKEFQMMKKTSFIINTSRGGIINEKALKYALQNNLIAGGAIDVYVEEPPLDLELLKLENLICTPHIGGNSKEAILEMGLSAIKYIKEFFNV